MHAPFLPPPLTACINLQAVSGLPLKDPFLLFFAKARVQVFGWGPTFQLHDGNACMHRRIAPSFKFPSSPQTHLVDTSWLKVQLADEPALVNTNHPTGSDCSCNVNKHVLAQGALCVLQNHTLATSQQTY